VVGGDCSLLVAAGLALRRAGGYGLVHLDGHTDFRHPGNSAACASLAGEDLAAAVGRHWPAVADLDGLGPSFQPSDVVHAGCRDQDEHLTEVGGLLAMAVPASVIVGGGAATAAEGIGAALRRPDLGATGCTWTWTSSTPRSCRRLTALIRAPGPRPARRAAGGAGAWCGGRAGHRVRS
jgi:arginase